MNDKRIRAPRLIFAFVAFLVTAHGADVSPSEFKARRAELMRRFPNGIVLLHARSDFISQTAWYQHTFHEDPSFYYFSGVETSRSSILAVDGTSRETWLFAPTKLSGRAVASPAPGADLAGQLGIEHAAPWEEFVPWIERRLASNPPPTLYVDDTDSWWGQRRFGRDIPESNPPGLDPIVDSKLLWRLSIERRWPAAKVQSASPVIHEMRFVKSPAEIERMRAASKATVEAWFRGAEAVGNGDSPRQVEAAVVRACTDNGAQGPSFWPILTGLHSDYYDPPKFPEGRLVQIDLGCDLDRYHTDTKRPVPVSGRFTPEQKEIWEFFVSAYRAGLTAIHDGARRDDVFEAMIREADRRKSTVPSGPVQKAAAAITDRQGASRSWLLHSMGLECCEAEPEILRAGMTVAFEPSIIVEGQSYTIEDVTLVTKDGYEVLAPLPYEAAGIERSMRATRH